MHDVGGIFRIAPGFFRGAFDLLSGSGVGQLLIADGFADTLFDFACYLVELSFNFFGVHT